jgi:hypothetical protein
VPLGPALRALASAKKLFVVRQVTVFENTSIETAALQTAYSSDAVTDAKKLTLFVHWQDSLAFLRTFP